MKKIFKVLLEILIIIIIIVNMITIYNIKILKSNYSNIFGYTYFNVISGSMYPAIKVGDVVIVKISKDVKKNNIITYNEEGSIVTHRLIKIDGKKYYTKGDYNDSEDKPIGKNAIIGKVVLTVPYLGKILSIFSNIYFIISLIIIYIINIIWDKKTNGENKNEEGN